MNILKNIPLAPYTTFKIGGSAKYFCVIKNEGEIVEAVQFAQKEKIPYFILGGGSNLLVSDNGFNGLVLKIEIDGIEKLPNKDSDNEIFIKAGAGVIWDKFVDFAVSNEFFGVENLSSIPGTVGASAVQNIGAYGSEASQAVSSVRVLDTESMEFTDLEARACLFGYRDSIFKKEKGRYVISNITFKLHRHGVLMMDYKDVREFFDKSDIVSPTIKDLRKAIIEIRASKLPDWSKWGTAGSFFKNPVIEQKHFDTLKAKYPDLPGFPEEDGRVKVSLGWILDKICNAKGMKNGKARIYEKQALVVVAENGATAKEVVELSNKIINMVKENTGIVIEAEVEWVC